MQIPQKIIRGHDNSIIIIWSASEQSSLSGEILRRHCPCASCRHINHDKILQTPIRHHSTSRLQIVTTSIDEAVQVKNLWTIGRYAIGVEFTDGHKTGIYTYDFLKQLSSS